MRYLLTLLLTTAAFGLAPLHVAEGQFRTPANETVGLFGADLYQGAMMYARLQDPAPALADLRAMAAHGLNFVRIPMNAAYVMPAEGVLPDSPQYAKTLADHGLKAGYVPLLDELLGECAKLGLYAMVEFHEYPTDPYRWFAGGEERKRGTGQPGGAIDWMAAPGMIRKHTPAMLGWLAGHWRGRPELMGIEVPHNEPHGDGPDDTGAGLKAFAGDCAAAIKAADPDRLCVLAVGDWGAGVNRVDDSFVWDLPAGIDALTPHFYLGMHNNQSPLPEAYTVAPASWLSWFRGSGKPLIVGEWGTAHIAYPKFQKFDSSDLLTQRLSDACLAGWLAEGAQGVARWAWDGGLDDPKHQQRLGEQAAAMLKYAPMYAQNVLGAASVAVVLDPRRRAAYGAPKDLTRITAALLDLGVHPFDTLFAAQVAAHPEVLARYTAVLLYTPDLDPAVAKTVRACVKAVVELADDQVDVAALGKRLAAAGVTVPEGPHDVWAFANRGHWAIFNRSGKPAVWTLHGPANQRLVDRLTGAQLAAPKQDVRLELPPFGSRDLQYLLPGQQPDAVSLVPPPVRPAQAGVPLYDHGGVIGRWVAGWGGGQAAPGQDEAGKEVLVVTTRGTAQLGGLNFNRHQPVDLAPWWPAKGATLRLRVRVVAGHPDRLQVRLAGPPADGLATVALAATGDWQTVEVPLAAVKPQPEKLTGLFAGALDEGTLQLAELALVRAPDA